MCKTTNASLHYARNWTHFNYCFSLSVVCVYFSRTVRSLIFSSHCTWTAQFIFIVQSRKRFVKFQLVIFFSFKLASLVIILLDWAHKKKKNKWSLWTRNWNFGRREFEKNICWKHSQKNLLYKCKVLKVELSSKRRRDKLRSVKF